MGYSEIYDLHINLLRTYTIHKKCDSPFQREINHFTSQLRFAEDTPQRIFVLNQIIKIYEKERNYMIKWCQDRYSLKANSQDGII